MTLPPFPSFCADVLGLDTSTRAGMLAFFAALDGEALTDDQRAIVERFTGGAHVSARRRQGVLQGGRQMGKSEGAAARLVYKAAGAVLAGKRNRWFVGVAQDARAGQRALFGHVRSFAERPLLAPLVQRVTADTIELEAGNALVIMPCRPAAWRGLAVDEFVMDEPEHYTSSEGRRLDVECWRAALPALATTNGSLVAVSSPRAGTGLLGDLYRRFYGKPDAPLLFWKAPSHAMNPCLDQTFLDHLRTMDPAGAVAEVEGEFMEGMSALLDDDVIDAAVDVGVQSREPWPGLPSYRAFYDASGGRADAAALGIARRDENATSLECLKVWPAPHQPAEVIGQAAAVLNEHGLRAVEGDRFAGQFVAEAFRAHGVTYRASELDRSAIYAEFAARMQSRTVRLLDDAVMLRQLRGLERRRGTNGRDRVDHRVGAHDDAINAAAGAVVAAAAKPAGVLSGRLVW